MEQHLVTLALASTAAVCLLVGMNPDKKWAVAAVSFALLAVVAHFTGLRPEHLAVLHQ